MISNGLIATFTGSSNLLYALEASLKRYRMTDVYRETVEVSTWLTAALGQLGFKIVAPQGHASPAVITVSLPSEVSSAALGRSLDEAGYLLSYNSDYLLSRSDEFLRTVTEKLLAYALGRELRYYDAPTVRQIVRDAGGQEARWTSVLLGIVKSVPFQMRRVAVPGETRAVTEVAAR